MPWKASKVKNISCSSTTDSDLDRIQKHQKATITNFVSPLKALAFNFRFNQFFGIFPGRINEEWTEFVIDKKFLLLTFSIKSIFVSIILAFFHLWLQEQGIDFTIFMTRISTHAKFTVTDTFAMMVHFFFLQLSALILFFNNLNLGPELTHLVAIVIDLNARYNGANPSAKKLMLYRISICVLCTIASGILFVGVWNITANPNRSFGFLDFGLTFIIIVALYVENQNHMFSELLFLRFTEILDDRFNNLLKHTQENHFGRRNCCPDHCKSIFKLYLGINKAFGADLLVSVTILVISMTFGLYLVLTFSIFIGITQEPILFTVYCLYSLIPCLRLYVLAEGAQKTVKKMSAISGKLEKIQVSEESESWTCFEQKQFSLAVANFAKPEGYDAAGFFQLNRKLIPTIIGALVTYLIVLLTFKLSDSTTQEIMKKF